MSSKEIAGQLSIPSAPSNGTVNVTKLDVKKSFRRLQAREMGLL
jgi:hypothetical protein